MIQVAVDDTITEIIAYLDSDGTVALTAEREGSDSGLGELTGIRVVPEEEYITVNTGSFPDVKILSELAA